MAAESHEPPASAVKRPERNRTPEDEMRRYRCLVGHLICQSLGYFTPKAALRAVQSHREQEPFACEWYCHQAHCLAKDYFDRERLLQVHRDVIAAAFRGRNGHTGYMTEYEHAKQLIQREIGEPGSTQGMLASRW
jgi:hypothetical protein